MTDDLLILPSDFEDFLHSGDAVDEEKALKEEARDDHGRWTNGGSSDTANRVERAKASHKPMTKDRKAWANKAEALIAKMIGGDRTPDNSPADITVKIGSKLHGLEVKAFLDNAHDKLTMHPASRIRKEEWADDHSASLHTVAVDYRKHYDDEGHLKKPDVYYKRGVGAYRLAGMVKVKGPEHLRQLMTSKAKAFYDPEELKAFNEDQHPRDSHGRFGEGSAAEDATMAYVFGIGSTGAYALSDKLRKGKPLDKEQEQAVKTLDSLMTELGNKNLETYRGVDMAFAKTLVEGSTFTDKSFVSVSKSHEVAQEFGDVYMVVTLPKGIKGLDVNKSFESSKDAFQKEIILQRGLTFKVTNVELFDGAGQIDVTAVVKK